MTFRNRILIACLLVAVAPLVAFAIGARVAVRDRLIEDFDKRVATSSELIRKDLDRQAANLDARLRAQAQRFVDDAALRAALMQNTDRQVLLDLAPSVMSTLGLDYLTLTDSSGLVLSSGHFRNDYDRQMLGLAGLLKSQGPALVAARRPSGNFLALARAQRFRVGEQTFTLIGGIKVDSAFLNSFARGEDSTVVITLDYPGGSLATAGKGEGPVGADILLPYIDDVSGDNKIQQARWSVTHSLDQLQAVQGGLDKLLLGAIVAAAVLAYVIARVLAERVNRPLEELAEKTRWVNLDQAVSEFATPRQDEIGTLSRLLDRMLQRLRASARQLRDAERRATVGDMARQVNHDIRNGLLPIRNVIHHLTEVAREEPGQLPTVFAEREGTLQGGISYLESLASNYARLTPRNEQRTIDVNALVRTALQESAAADGARIQLDLSKTMARVSADPVALRRVIENLAINAIESLQNGKGGVSVSTAVQDRRVTITVSDTGSGIDAAALDRIFDDFYTTKERGTGLGLSIVRRLVADMGGRIRVESQVGRGTTFRVELPEAP
jgi:signal transduction histidine kinase